MAVRNALASIAVGDFEAATAWYGEVLGSAATTPMPELAEWRFPRGGALQVYRDPDRAGEGSCTLAVDDLAEIERQLRRVGIDTSHRSSSDAVDTLTVTDTEGNSIAFAEAHAPRLAS